MPTHPGSRQIPLSQEKFALVDEADYVSISKHKWYAMENVNSGRFYAVRHSPARDGKSHLIYMHRQILGLGYKDPREGDHRIITETLDNRRSNLRIVTDQQQQWHKGRYKSNKSGFKGVSYCRERGNYLACISIKGRIKNLGRRSTAEEAYALYLSAATAIHGEYLHIEQGE
jgi:hypothetical protein